ncbi:hypothetical protein [Oceanobacillus manasiensis]|uniref:hypothetical protein n=1 Tax=Oceanobacillus manasiensis TaxID=586413 RepID=UPI0018DDEA0A|nr:hypothetical protein [Oceanobacillus manasiensis]
MKDKDINIPRLGNEFYFTHIKEINNQLYAPNSFGILQEVTETVIAIIIIDYRSRSSLLPLEKTCI